MNQWLVLTIVLFSMLAGALGVGVAVFFYILLRNVQKLTDTVNVFMQGLDQKSISRLIAALSVIGQQGELIIAGMSEMTKAAKLVNESVFGDREKDNPFEPTEEAYRVTPAPPPTRKPRKESNMVTPGVARDTKGEMAAEDEASFLVVSEEDAAKNETLHELEKQGLPTDERRAPAVPEKLVLRVDA